MFDVSSQFSNPAYVYVVSAGRSGQASLSNILQQAYLNSYVAFEEPQIKNIFYLDACRGWNVNFVVNSLKLIDTGRGKVLTAFCPQRSR